LSARAYVNRPHAERDSPLVQIGPLQSGRIGPAWPSRRPRQPPRRCPLPRRLPARPRCREAARRPRPGCRASCACSARTCGGRTPARLVGTATPTSPPTRAIASARYAQPGSAKRIHCWWVCSISSPDFTLAFSAIAMYMRRASSDMLSRCQDLPPQGHVLAFHLGQSFLEGVHLTAVPQRRHREGGRRPGE